MEEESRKTRTHKHNTRYHISHDHVKHPVRFADLLLFQIGRTHCREDTVIATHAHLNWFELTVATDGEGSVFTNGKQVQIQHGDIFLSFPGDIHGITSDPESPLKYDFYAFYPLAPDLIDALEEIMRERTNADQRILRDDRIEFLLGNALAEINQPGEFSERLLSAIFQQILLYVIGDFHSMQAPSTRKAVGEREELCYQMMNYIDTHIYSIKSLGELADIFCYNYSYLSDLFHKVTKESLKSYYQNRRLKVAKKLFQDNSLSISQIAELLHYSSIYTFSRAFKEKYGKAPIHYRETK